MCANCEHHLQRGVKLADIPPHHCHIGGRSAYGPDQPEWENSSGAMEASGFVHGTNVLGALRVGVKYWCSDGDSKLGAAVKRDCPLEFTQYMEQGRDHNHMQKGMITSLIALKKNEGWSHSVSYTDEQSRKVAKLCMTVVKDNRDRVQQPGRPPPPYHLTVENAITNTRLGMETAVLHKFNHHEKCPHYSVRYSFPSPL